MGVSEGCRVLRLISILSSWLFTYASGSGEGWVEVDQVVKGGEQKKETDRERETDLSVGGLFYSTSKQKGHTTVSGDAITIILHLERSEQKSAWRRAEKTIIIKGLSHTKCVPVSQSGDVQGERRSVLGHVIALISLPATLTFIYMWTIRNFSRTLFRFFHHTLSRRSLLHHYGCCPVQLWQTNRQQTVHLHVRAFKCA